MSPEQTKFKKFKNNISSITIESKFKHSKKNEIIVLNPENNIRF